MKTKKTWLVLLAALALTAVAALATGCGDDDDTSGASAAGNRTDAAFVADMTAHHQSAIDMAKLAKTKAEHPELRTLATAIITTQQEEITTLKAVGAEMQAAGVEAGDMGMSDEEMGMDMDMTTLENATPFDRAFIDAMVAHHEGAITMARTELDDGTQPTLRKLAGEIIDAQGKEISQMTGWRTAWYGSTGTSKTTTGDGHDMDMGG